MSKGASLPARKSPQRGAPGTPAQTRGASGPRLRIRRARTDDIPTLIALDHRITGMVKREYWHDIFERYGNRRLHERFFLVAEPGERSDPESLLGYIIGEVRAWEFGSEPCGWVFAFSVDPQVRQQRIGEQLFEAISSEFRSAGIKTMRTMVARDNQLHLAFFRGEGMMAGRYVQLEKDLE